MCGNNNLVTADITNQNTCAQSGHNLWENNIMSYNYSLNQQQINKKTMKEKSNPGFNGNVRKGDRGKGTSRSLRRADVGGGGRHGKKMMMWKEEHGCSHPDGIVEQIGGRCCSPARWLARYSEG